METSFFDHKQARFLAMAVMIAVIGALASYMHLSLVQAEQESSDGATITVTGEGEVFAKPDIGSFSFSVMAEAEDAAGAQQASAENINKILTYLEEEGVAEADIKTQYYNLNPKYTYEERICVAGRSCPPGERVIDGYEVNQSVTVKVRDLDTAGDLISGAGERGATNISSLQFTIDDQSSLEAEARSQAIADAKENAKELADKLAVRLVQIVGFNEQGGGYYPQPYAMKAEMESMSFDSAVSPQLPTGENEVTSVVSITYEVK